MIWAAVDIVTMLIIVIGGLHILKGELWKR